MNDKYVPLSVRTAPCFSRKRLNWWISERRHRLALRIAPWFGGIDRVGEERDELRASLRDMPGGLYYSERKLWYGCPEARDVLARLARTRASTLPRISELESTIRSVLDLRSSYDLDRGRDVPVVSNLQAREMLQASLDRKPPTEAETA